MREIVLIDTCIFLNVLDVPGFNQDRNDIFTELERLIARETVNLLLPFAAIIETGNHIAQLSDGRLRRSNARLFVDQVSEALAGKAPWTPTQSAETDDLAMWLAEFPDRAMAGIGLGDLSIIKEWEAACTRHPRHRVRIWTIDGGLTGFDRTP